MISLLIAHGIVFLQLGNELNPINLTYCLTYLQNQISLIEQTHSENINCKGIQTDNGKIVFLGKEWK